eukprot:ctg_101.g43
MRGVTGAAEQWGIGEEREGGEWGALANKVEVERARGDSSGGGLAESPAKVVRRSRRCHNPVDRLPDVPPQSPVSVGRLVENQLKVLFT